MAEWFKLQQPKDATSHESKITERLSEDEKEYKREISHWLLFININFQNCIVFQVILVFVWEVCVMMT